MHTNFAKSLRTAALVVIGSISLHANPAAADGPETFQVVDGVAIYLGVMPAQLVQGHAKGHEETKMHGGVPPGRYRDHVVVALFDDASGRRIEDAKVTAAVMELGLGAEWKTLEPMRINASVTYGNYFDFPDDGTYHIQVKIRLQGHPQPVEATFTHRHYAR